MPSHPEPWHFAAIAEDDRFASRAQTFEIAQLHVGLDVALRDVMSILRGPSNISASASARAVQMTTVGLLTGRHYEHHGYGAYRAQSDTFVLQNREGRILLRADRPGPVATLFVVLGANPEAVEPGVSYLRKREVAAAGRSPLAFGLRAWTTRTHRRAVSSSTRPERVATEPA